MDNFNKKSKLDHCYYPALYGTPVPLEENISDYCLTFISLISAFYFVNLTDVHLPLFSNNGA
nr:unnamed protein product [Callosobruchus analis]